MMDCKTITEALLKTFGSEIEIEKRSEDRSMVHTGYTYPDGDELHILIEKSNDSWVLTDEGHTMMWLSYENFKMTDVIKKILDKTLNSNGVSLKEGELSIVCPENSSDLGFVLRMMIQTEIQIADFLYLDRENVKDTFLDDLKASFVNSDLSDKCLYNHIIVGDDNMEYCADIYIKSKRPIVIFGIHSPIQCSRATIAMLSLNKIEQKYIFMAVIDSKGSIPNKDVKKAVNAAIKTTYDISDAVDGARRLLLLT